MFENNTYTTQKAKNGMIIRGKSVDELRALIGNELDEMLEFIFKFGATLQQFETHFDLYIPKDCPVGADSIIDKIGHAKRVNRSLVDKQWRGHI